MFDQIPSSSHVALETTLRSSVSCEGIGLHCGKTVRMALLPAPAGTGIIFRRLDLLSCNSADAQSSSLQKVSIIASPNAVITTQLGTTLANEYGIEIATVEHLMSAFAACGIDNVIVEIDSPELPIMDGSADPFLALIDQAGIRQLKQPKLAIRVTEKISVTDGDRWAYVLPHKSDDNDGFEIDVLVDYADPAIGKQRATFTVEPSTYRSEIATARTFCYMSDVEAMRARGLALGGSLDNAIVVNNGQIENEGGLRLDNEFASHKALDLLGDLYLLGHAIQGRVMAFKPGHDLNVMLAQAILSNPDKFEFVNQRLGEEVDELVLAKA